MMVCVWRAGNAGRGAEVAEQVVGALGEGERGHGPGGNDGNVGGIPEERVGDGAGAEGVGGEGGVHAEDVADEFVVGIVIDHVVVGDDEGENGEGGDQEELARRSGMGWGLLVRLMVEPIHPRNRKRQRKTGIAVGPAAMPTAK